jgi:CBS domain-containing protein
METTVKDLMKANPSMITPDSTLKDAARKMASIDCGVLPVGAQYRVEGVITDRDIIIRAIAQGKDIEKEKVRDFMSTEVVSCSENDSLEEVANKMHENRVSRILVQNESGGLSGILSFGCILRKHNNRQ